MSKLGHDLTMLIWMPAIVLATTILIHNMTITGITCIGVMGVISSVINLYLWLHFFEDAIYCDQNPDQYVRREWNDYIHHKTTTSSDRQKLALLVANSSLGGKVGSATGDISTYGHKTFIANIEK